MTPSFSLIDIGPKKHSLECFLAMKGQDKVFPGHLAAGLRAIQSAVTRRFTEAGFSFTCEQWRTIRHLHDQSELTQRELQEKAEKSQSSMSKMIFKLREQDLLEVKHCCEDRRCRKIYLTQKGKTILHQLDSLADEVLQKALTGISIEDLERSIEVITCLRTNLHQTYHIPLL